MLLHVHLFQDLPIPSRRKQKECPSRKCPTRSFQLSFHMPVEKSSLLSILAQMHVFPLLCADLLASTLSTVIQTIASTSFNEAAETADIHCSQQKLKWCVRTDSTDPFTWHEGCVVSGELDGKPFPSPPGKVKARVDSKQIVCRVFPHPLDNFPTHL